MAVVPRPLLEILILDALRHNLMRPELVAEFVRAFSEETDRARRAAELQVEARRRELGEVARKLDGPVEAMAEGSRAPGLQAKLDALESRKAAPELGLRRARPGGPSELSTSVIFRIKFALRRDAADSASTGARGQA